MRGVSPIRVRPVQPADLPFLGAMLYEAAAVDPGIRAMDMAAALALPQMRKYLDAWGRPGDAGVVALDESGRPLGAAWCRLFPPEAPGYGFVAADVPELTIAVAAEARGRGVGGALLAALKAAARREGHGRLSLSVNRRNPARRLYERHGFHDAGVSAPTDSSVTMVADLAPPAAG